MEIKKSVFGKLEGSEVNLYELKNDNGVVVKFITYGAIVTSVVVPDKNGKFENVNAGFDNLDRYLKGHPYLGAICGRYANRIAEGRFKVAGKEYKLAINNGPNALHGGIKGFDKVIWNEVEIIKNEERVGVTLSYLSKDMEEGFPGNLKIKVTYSLNNMNDFSIEYLAETDKETVLNVTNHAYFNLSGFKKNIYDHELTINSDRITDVNENQIPIGTYSKVESTIYDFRKPKRVGMDIEEAPFRGFDHNFALNKIGKNLSFAARLIDNESGRVMDAYTTEPGVQLYTGNYLDDTLVGPEGKVYGKHSALCLEMQHYPDSPNHSEFPETGLKPGEKYYQKTIYRFSVL